MVPGPVTPSVGMVLAPSGLRSMPTEGVAGPFPFTSLPHERRDHG